MSEDQSVDFLKKKYKFAPDRRSGQKQKTVLRVVGVFLAIVAFSGIAFSYQIAGSTPSETEVGTGNFSLFNSFRKLVTSGEKELVGEEDDRINALLLGVGGAGHDGPELTDTIIFASYKPSANEVGLMSIPRDTIVPIPGYGYRKINHINAYGELDEPGSGADAAREVIGELIDQEIHYVVKVDFDGFEQLIDAIGGIDVYVDRSFTDYTYPTDNHLVQTVQFEEGWTSMDGETALQFSRSRHGTNGEGSDFARAARQQKVILAVKDKILSAGTLLNPGRLNKIIQTFQDNVETNLTFWEMTKLAKYAPDIQTENIHHAVLDSSASSPLYASNINGAYVLLPKKDDWSEVQGIAENIFSENSMTDAAGETAVSRNVAQIEIQNGTSITGLAFQTSQLLANSGFEVQQIGNADNREHEKTIIYDLTEGTKAEELALLKDFLEADVAMTTTGWIYADEVVPRELSVTTLGEEYKTTSEPIDFLVILGESAESLVLR